MQASKLQPVLLGGVVIGVLSALPVVNIGNCCCLWILSGGALAAYLLQQNQPAPITSGDGAVVGLLAGLVGAAVYTLLSIPIMIFFGPMQALFMQRMLEGAGDVPPEMRPWLDNVAAAGGFSVFGLLMSSMFMLVVGFIFGALGGMLGALFFRKELPPPLPPPAPTTYPPPFNPPPL